jgi:hypothetical protein
MKKYGIRPIYDEPKIHEVARETASSIFKIGYNGKETREAKSSTYFKYFDTWEEAHEELNILAQRKLDSARRNLELAHSFVGNVKGMKCPQPAVSQPESNLPKG